MTRHNPAKVCVLALAVYLLVLLCGPVLAAQTFIVSSSNVTVLTGGGYWQDTVTLSGLSWHGPDNGYEWWVQGWDSTSDTFTWSVTADKTENYELAMVYSTTYGAVAGSTFEVACGSSKVTGTIRATSGLISYQNAAWERVGLSGTLTVPAGNSTITLKCTYKSGGSEVARFLSLELTSAAVKAAMADSSNRAKAARADTDWMRETYGLMVHWVAPTLPKGGGSPLSSVYDTATANFNVENFANMVKETGAAYLIFHHGVGADYPAPIDAWEKYMGAGTATSRDLIGEIADALRQRGIKFIAGYGFGNPGNMWLGVDTYHERFTEVMDEIGLRYGNRIHGYFFDGGVRELYPYSSWHDQFPLTSAQWEDLFAANKMGNSSRVTSYNYWVYPLLTDWLEYWTGEGCQNFNSPPTSRIIQSGVGAGLQHHVMFPCDDYQNWYHWESRDIGPPLYSNTQLINYIKSSKRIGAVSMNIGLYQDGTVGPSSLSQMQAIRAAITSINNASGATNVTVSSADMKGILVSSGGYSTSVYMYWGETDATNNKSGWAHNNYFGTYSISSPTALSTNISGLAPGTTYYYRFYASNAGGDAWAMPSESFTTTASTPVINNASGATGVTAYAAWLNGILTSTGKSSVAIYVFWGATDGGSNRLAWSHTNYIGVHTGAVPRTYSTNVTGLSPSSTYYYRYYGTNTQGQTWASPSQSFLTEPLPFDSTFWSYRMKFTFSGYNKTETLTNFPALVTLSESQSGLRYNQFKSGGADLRFVSDSGTELNYEIEKWDTNGSSSVWVQLRTLASSSTYVWAYWGNPSATAPAYATNGSTWSQGYRGVWHLDDIKSPNLCPESTARKYNGTNGGTDNVTGKIAGAKNFSGSDYIALPANAFSSITDKVTFSFWQYGTPPVTNNIFFSGQSPGPVYQLHAHIPWGGNNIFYTFGDTHIMTTNGGEVGRWNLWAVQRDGGTVRIYQNGSQVLYETGKTGVYSKITSFNLGTYNYNGIMDEIRVSDVARSSNWIWACWANQSSNSSFNSYGSFSNIVASVGPRGTPQNWLQSKGLTNYADLAAAENDDPDQDGMKTWEEYYAGVEPTNNGSVFAVRIAYSNGNILVSFPAVLASGTGYSPGVSRYYDLERSSNLVAGVWLPVSTNILGNGSTFVHTNVTGNAFRFYRTKARLK